MTFLKALLLVLLLGVLGATAFVYFGLFDIAADHPHSALVFDLMETTRVRAIAAHATAVTVPPLDDPSLLPMGAEHYAAMCTECHLAPGMEDSEIRAGLYPQPPKLSDYPHPDAAQLFWVIKHGLKMSGMPAWGPTHDDTMIWAMVVFVQKLPTLTPSQYQALVGPSNVGAPAHHGSENHADTETTPTATHTDHP
ncbi:cytochrome c [Pseudolysobacter antarcticus]|uniref:Cytochrome c n=1 Tax=Pseudolysobacter antarcticus TaxID=2511995 RepID=A0A411HK06_9GAMM|nr:cytochrome c [Pseudolysobacter antarcticus]QBB70734.1 cytochrome c [Pseudolysobacter antarcticus]